MTSRLMLLGLMLSACDPAASSPCGEGGEYYEDEALGRYCAYVVIVGGFSCPTELPHLHELGEYTVCADHMIPPTGPVPRALCADLGTACPMPVVDLDAGMPDVDAGGDAGPECDPVLQTGCGADEKCTWVVGASGSAAGDTRCVADGTVALFQPCTESAGGVADDCAAGGLCVAGEEFPGPNCVAICSMASTVPPQFCRVRTDVFDDRPGVGHRDYVPCSLALHDCPPDQGCYRWMSGELLPGLDACHAEQPGAGVAGASCTGQRDCARYHGCIDGSCERLCLDVAGNPGNPDVCPAGTACTTVTAFPGLGIGADIDLCR
jgi:hypothetical protein